MIFQFFSGGPERFTWIGSKTIQHKVGCLRPFCQLCAASLSPVPSSASDASRVSPDDFTRFRVGDLLLSILHRQKRFWSLSIGQVEITDQLIPIPHPHRQDSFQSQSILNSTNPPD